jgi:hypothetical protein
MNNLLKISPLILASLVYSTQSQGNSNKYYDGLAIEWVENDLRARECESPYAKDYVLGKLDNYNLDVRKFSCELKEKRKYNFNQYHSKTNLSSDIFDKKTLREIRKLERKIGTKEGNFDLIAMIESSGEPYKTNEDSNAISYIQITPSNLKFMGLLEEAVLNMEPQAIIRGPITWYFEDTLQNIHGINKLPDESLGTLYLSVAAPAHLFKSNSHIAYKSGTQSYNFNKPWDLNKNGETTVGEIKQFASIRAKQFQ